jgi:MFS family permease
LAFTANSFTNSFSFMGFTGVPNTTQQLFGFCGDDDVGSDPALCNNDLVDPETFVLTWTYGAILIFVVPALLPIMRYLGSKNWWTMFLCFIAQVVGAWFRWLCCILAQNGHFSAARLMCLASSALIGVGTALIITCFSFISVRWFPAREQTLANSIAVVSNYFGWALSAVIIPYTVTGTESLTQLQLYQAIAMTAALVAFLVYHREWPETTGVQDDQEARQRASEEVSVTHEVRQLLANRQYVLQCFCYSMLTGVAYSVPGFATIALTDLSLTVQESAWVNFAFIMTGVSSAMLLGRVVTKPAQFPRVLRTVFVIATIGLAAIVLLINYQTSMDQTTVYALVIVANMVTGAGSLSFLGVAFSAAVEATYPVDAEFSGGIIELWVQIWGFLFTYVSSDGMDGMDMFIMVTVPTALCTLFMLVFYKQEFRKSDPDQLREKLIDQEQIAD